MKKQHVAEIKSMTDVQLDAAMRIVARQINAKIFVGFEKKDRVKVWKAMDAERQRRSA